MTSLCNIRDGYGDTFQPSASHLRWPSSLQHVVYQMPNAVLLQPLLKYSVSLVCSNLWTLNMTPLTCKHTVRSPILQATSRIINLDALRGTAVKLWDKETAGQP